MNFLAHVFLSSHDFDLALGNLIADQIKGKAYLNLPSKIQEGVLLHRKMDYYTDRHPAFKQCVKKLFHSHRHYSNVLVDMFFDHFLAKNWNQYHPQKLTEFTTQFYAFLSKNQSMVPEPCSRFLGYLIQYNWFEAYATLDGLEQILAQMEKRTQFESNLAWGRVALENDYTFFESHFTAFLADITQHFKIQILC